MAEHIIMDEAAVARTLKRLSHEVVEKNKGTDGLCFLGIRRRGELLVHRICTLIEQFYGVSLPCEGIDIGMYRDDLVSDFFVPDAEVNSLNISVENKKVILCDDVLYTGRSVRAAIEAIFDLGRPSKIELLVLCDRGGREVPVSADFVGKNVPTSHSEYVNVCLKEIEGYDSLGIESQIAHKEI